MEIKKKQVLKKIVIIFLLLALIVFGVFFFRSKSNEVGKSSKKPEEDRFQIEESYLGGKEYIIDLVKQTEPSIDSFNFEKGYVSMVSADFDKDEKEEVLLFSVSDETYMQSVGREYYILTLSMYEKEEGQWQQAAIYDLGFGMPRSLYKSDFFLKEYEDGVHIFMENRITAFYANGGLYSVTEIKYSEMGFEEIPNETEMSGSGTWTKDYFAKRDTDLERMELEFNEVAMNLDEGIMDYNDVQKIARIKNELFVESEKCGLWVNSNSNRIKGAVVSIWDYTNKDLKVLGDKNTHFAKNPIDTDYEISCQSSSGGTFDFRSKTGEYAEAWNTAIKKAYEELIAIVPDKDTEAIRQESEDWRKNAKEIARANIQKELEEFGDTGGGTIELDISAKANYDTYREKAVEVFDQLYQYNPNYVISYTSSLSSADIQSYDTSITADVDSSFIFPLSSYEYLTKEDVKVLSDKELFYARNEIMARHGRIFKSEELMAYFSNKSWYRGVIQPEEFTDDMLNEYELENVQVILTEEKARGLQ
ncbi:hypothetical protein M2145_001378 [Lachnospiraceae bacterium PF1-21]|uniref:YARHG domain-containing protein n=1 Tax=Ohessyouella blattaphilus TaxID=2949333 RepID=UPI003E2B7E54